jgi:hypothetical protein
MTLMWNLTGQAGRNAFCQETDPPCARHSRSSLHVAAIAQLGERETEDLEVLGSIPSCGSFVGARTPIVPTLRLDESVTTPSGR